MGFKIVLPPDYVEGSKDIITPLGTRFFYNDQEIINVERCKVSCELKADNAWVTHIELSIAQPITIVDGSGDPHVVGG